MLSAGQMTSKVLVFGKTRQHEIDSRIRIIMLTKLEHINGLTHGRCW